MIEIGKKLQKRRKELNLSYEDVSEITKLSLPHLKAIEEGNLDYFKDDLTYVRFYVRSYCKALNVPYENFKDDIADSVEEYTNTITLKKQEQIELAEKNIAQRNQTKPVVGNSILRKEVETLMKENKGPKAAKKDRASISQNAQQNRRFTSRKMDIPMLSFLAVLVVVLGIVIYVGVGSLLKEDTPDTPDEPNPPVVDTVPTPEDNVDDAVVDKTEDNEENKEEVKKVMISTVNMNTYSVSNIKVGDKVKIEVGFADNQCWFDGTFNYAPIPNDRAGKIYGPNETYTIENVVGNADVYEFKFGYFPGSSIVVNGEKINFDPSLATLGNVVTIYVQVKGE